MQLETARLILRPPIMSDAPRMAELANDFEVVRYTRTMPHPYTQADAVAFIESAQAAWERMANCIFVLVPKDEDQLIGMIFLRPDAADKRAEIGYWVGVPCWGQGYATEAAKHLVDWGFQYFALQRIYAMCVSSNVGSGSVLRKTGMMLEGTLRQHVVRFGETQDIEAYGILRSEWEAAQMQAAAEI